MLSLVKTVFGREYEFRFERVSKVLEDIKSIIKLNHEETGVFLKDFDPAFDRYVRLEDMGFLSFMSVRFDNKIVGYSIYFIDEPIYQKGLILATQSTTFIIKEHRGVGMAFMRFCDESLKSQGVNSVIRQASSKLDLSKVYERLGYILLEKSYIKGL